MASKAKKKAKKKVKKQSKARRRNPARKKSARTPARRSKPSMKNMRAERDLEEGLRETFPGSDPLAVTDPTRSIKE